MKYYILLLTVFVFYSCSEKTNKGSNKVFTPPVNYYAVTDDPEIFGNWQQCAESGKGIFTHYNVCNAIIFNPDGSGIKTGPNEQHETFSWRLKSGELRIINNTKNPNATFADTSYIVIFNNEPDLIRLEIRQGQKDYSLILMRENNR